mmetsp:Transcript_18598/g.70616  ORF Transcript_18598/g.70616 Transcript_18598/m.70616 type:complete len:200 (+) Transcript_18598:250-849(+)
MRDTNAAGCRPCEGAPCQRGTRRSRGWRRRVPPSPRRRGSKFPTNRRRRRRARALVAPQHGGGPSGDRRRRTPRRASSRGGHIRRLTAQWRAVRGHLPAGCACTSWRLLANVARLRAASDVACALGDTNRSLGARDTGHERVRPRPACLRHSCSGRAVPGGRCLCALARLRGRAGAARPGRILSLQGAHAQSWTAALVS